MKEQVIFYLDETTPSEFSTWLDIYLSKKRLDISQYPYQPGVNIAMIYYYISPIKPQVSIGAIADRNILTQTENGEILSFDTMFRTEDAIVISWLKVGERLKLTIVHYNARWACYPVFDFLVELGEDWRKIQDEAWIYIQEQAHKYHIELTRNPFAGKGMQTQIIHPTTIDPKYVTWDEIESWAQEGNPQAIEFLSAFHKKPEKTTPISEAAQSARAKMDSFFSETETAILQTTVKKAYQSSPVARVVLNSMNLQQVRDLLPEIVRETLVHTDQSGQVENRGAPPGLFSDGEQITLDDNLLNSTGRLHKSILEKSFNLTGQIAVAVGTHAVKQSQKEAAEIYNEQQPTVGIHDELCKKWVNRQSSPHMNKSEFLNEYAPSILLKTFDRILLDAYSRGVIDKSPGKNGRYKPKN